MITKLETYVPFGVPSTKYHSHCGCVHTCMHTKGAMCTILFAPCTTINLSQTRSDILQTWNFRSFWGTKKTYNLDFWLCAHIWHKKSNMHSSFCNVHNHRFQQNYLRCSPNLELNVILRYQAQF